MAGQERTPNWGGGDETHLVHVPRERPGCWMRGDFLTAREGLAWARWQVLGALALADRPLTVPQIARRMGLTRQSVHATVEVVLVHDGVLEFGPNADHRRSALVVLTKEGLARYEAIDERQIAWINRLARGISRADIETALAVLDELCRRLEDDRGRGATCVGNRSRRGCETPSCGSARGGTGERGLGDHDDDQRRAVRGGSGDDHLGAVARMAEDANPDFRAVSCIRSGGWTACSRRCS